MKAILRLLTGTVALASVACGLEPAAAPVGTTATPVETPRPTESKTSIPSVASQEQEPDVATPTSTVASPKDDVGDPTPSTEDQIARLEERLGSLTYNEDDKILLEISKQIPEWGGYFIGDDGRVHVYMTDAAGEDKKADIADALSGVVQGHIIDHEGTTSEQRLSLTADDIVIEQGQYTMLQLLEWYWLTDFEPELGSHAAGAAGMAVSAGAIRLDLVAEEYREGALTKLKELGIPEEAVHISVTGPGVPEVRPADHWD